MKTIFTATLVAALGVNGLSAHSYGANALPPTPVLPVPAAYRDAGEIDRSGRAAVTQDWWLEFDDPVLNDLQSRALAASPTLQVALARVEQARALTGTARSSYLPSVALDASATRERNSTTVKNALPEPLANTIRVPLELTWELDLFGRVRRLNEAARAEFTAAKDNAAAARLALTADVAVTYFSLRAADRELRVVTDSTGLRRSALELVQSRYKRGNAAELDVARAETELASTEADAIALQLTRERLRNGLAVLIGEAAPTFQAPTMTDADPKMPPIPAGLPSELLTRRPDIASAEQTLTAANARIGVAKAAFFPTISLTGSAGYASSDIDDLFNRGSRIGSIGPSIYLPIFQGGRNRANLARTRALFEENLASYRERVLIAFREVQDALTASRLLDEQAQAQARAVASARRGAALSQKRYDAGYVGYLEVVDAQRTALEVERADAQLNGQRWLTHVTLIKALGGGWERPSS